MLRPSRRIGTPVTHWVVFALCAVAVLGPLVPVLLQAFSKEALYKGLGGATLGNFATLFGHADFAGVVWNSLLLALVTTIITLVVAALLAVLVVRTQAFGSKIIHQLVIWPLYISSMIIGFGAIVLYGPEGYVSAFFRNLTGQVPWDLYSIGGMAFVESVVMVPLAYLYCSAALRQADPSLEDAARTCGASPMMILIKIIWPGLRPPLFYAGILVFTGSLEALSVPLLFGTPANIETFGTFLYHRGLTQTSPDYGMLGAAAIMMLAFLVILIAIQGLALRNGRRFVSVRGKASQKRPLRLGWVLIPVRILAAVYLIAGPVLPILGVVARAFTVVLTPLVSPLKVLTVTNFAELFAFPTYPLSIINSVIIALVGSVVTTFLIMIVVLIVHRSNFRLGRPLELIAMAPQAIPGLIIGLGVFWALAALGPLGVIRSSILVLIFAFSMRAFPTAFASIAPSVMQIGQELDDAARTAGAGWWTTMVRVLRGLLSPALLSAMVLLFVGMIKEYTPAVFLATPGTEIIGTTMLTLWANGETGRVAALSCIQIVLTTFFVVAATRIMRVRSPEGVKAHG